MERQDVAAHLLAQVKPGQSMQNWAFIRPPGSTAEQMSDALSILVKSGQLIRTPAFPGATYSLPEVTPSPNERKEM